MTDRQILNLYNGATNVGPKEKFVYQWNIMDEVRNERIATLLNLYNVAQLQGSEKIVSQALKEFVLTMRKDQGLKGKQKELCVPKFRPWEMEKRSQRRRFVEEDFGMKTKQLVVRMEEERDVDPVRSKTRILVGLMQENQMRDEVQVVKLHQVRIRNTKRLRQKE